MTNTRVCDYFSQTGENRGNLKKKDKAIEQGAYWVYGLELYPNLIWYLVVISVSLSKIGQTGHILKGV